MLLQHIYCNVCNGHSQCNVFVRYVRSSLVVFHVRILYHPVTSGTWAAIVNQIYKHLFYGCLLLQLVDLLA